MQGVEITNFHARHFKICMYNCTFLHANKNLVFVLLEKIFMYLSMHTKYVCKHLDLHIYIFIVFMYLLDLYSTLYTFYF